MSARDSGSSAVLEASNLSRRFDGQQHGGVDAVRGVSFSVPRGEVVVFLGPNGAGKTTTMRMLAGLLSPTGGRASLLGHQAGQLPYAHRSRIGYLPEAPSLYEGLSPAEFLDFMGELHGLDPVAAGRRKRTMLEAFDLTEERDRRIRELSGGTRKRVALAGVFLHEPELVLLDEPTSGLDARSAARFKQMLVEKARAEGLTVLLSTHILEMAERLCDRVLILHRGRLVADGTLEQLRDRAGQGSLEEVFLELTKEQGRP